MSPLTSTPTFRTSVFMAGAECGKTPARAQLAPERQNARAARSRRAWTSSMCAIIAARASSALPATMASKMRRWPASTWAVSASVSSGLGSSDLGLELRSARG